MLKKISLVFGGICLLLILAALAAPFFISADAYKSQIIARVEAATGRTLTIDGALSIHFFPVAGIKAENVTLSNPRGFDDKESFVTLKALNIEVAVMPLLHKEIVIKNFVLEDPVINLRADKNGIKNWVFSKQTGNAGALNPGAQAELPARSEMASSNILPSNVQLSNFELKNGTVTYSDGTAAPVTISKLNASVKLETAATAAAIDASGEWNGKTFSAKVGVGTLNSLLREQKAELNFALSSDLFTLKSDGDYDKGTFSGKTTLKVGSLKELAGWLNPQKPLSSPTNLNFQADGDLRCGTNYCSFSGANFILDTLAAKGNIKVSFADKPAIEATLATNRLDLNPFLPGEQHGSLENPFITDANADAGRWSDAPIDVSVLTKFDVNASIQAEDVLYHRIALSKVQLNAKLQQGILSADVTNAALYNGTATITANLNANPSPPVFDTHLVLKGVSIEPLLRDAANYDKFSGSADIDTTLQSNCGSMKSLIAGLSGNGQARINNGEIKQFNISDILQNVGGAFAKAGTASQNTVFSQMSGSYTVASGVITNHDLTMTTQNMNVTGDGNVNLPAYTINYRLLPKLINGSGAQAKEGLTVPVIVEGSLDNPKFHPDLNAAVQNALQDPSKLKEQLKNSKGALLKNPDAVKNIKNLLQGFGR